MSDQAGPADGAFSSVGDPLVPDSGAGFDVWLRQIRRVAVRSWVSVLVVSFAGIVAPISIISVATDLTGVGGYLPPNLADLRGLVDRLHDSLAGLLVLALVILCAAYVCAAGWAAGGWVMTREAQTGRRASLVEAFRFGFGRAAALWPWLLAVGLAIQVGLLMCVLPGVYVAGAASLFGFAKIFEPSLDPVRRSFSLTHRHVATAAVRVTVSLMPYAGYSLACALVSGITFGAVLGIGGLTGTITTAGSTALSGVLVLIRAALLGPAIAAIMIGLFVTYADLRSRENPLTTGDLNAALCAPAGAG